VRRSIPTGVLVDIMKQRVRGPLAAEYADPQLERSVEAAHLMHAIAGNVRLSAAGATLPAGLSSINSMSMSSGSSRQTRRWPDVPMGW
jgi:hypothetical protein